MTAPDSPAPTAEDVIETAAINATSNLPSGDGLTQDDVFSWIEDYLTDAVVAAVRAMSVQQKAELIGGEIERQARLSSGKPIPLSTPLGLQTAERLGRPIESRVVGPWQVTP